MIEVSVNNRFYVISVVVTLIREERKYMFIPIPMSFKNPKTAQTVNIVLLAVGIALIVFFSMWIMGTLMAGFSAYNLIAMNSRNGGSGRNVGRQSDKDGFV